MSDEGTDPVERAHIALAHLVADARKHAAGGETDALFDTLEVVEAVARSELPDGDLRDRLRFGRARVAYHADADYEVAVEYLRAMERRL